MQSNNLLFYLIKYIYIYFLKATIQMKYYHSPHCADCDGAHPTNRVFISLSYSFIITINLFSL